jgi:hypothetical protein
MIKLNPRIEGEVYVPPPPMPARPMYFEPEDVRPECLACGDRGPCNCVICTRTVT